MSEEIHEIRNIKDLTDNIAGLFVRKLVVKGKAIYIMYIPELTDKNTLSENIIKPLLQYNEIQMLTADLIMNSIIYIDNVFAELDINKMTDYLTEGKSLIVMSGSNKYLVTNTLKVEKRGIEAPEVEGSIRAPRDAFNENITSNLSLIRYRIKDSSLKTDFCTVGVRTKTSVVLVYLQDVANPKLVTEIKDKLKAIKVDGILESGHIQKYLLRNSSNLFSQIGISERSDSACANILEGRVCILVEGSNLALIAPKNFIAFLDAGDDHYDNVYLGRFIKVIRFAALMITLTLSSLYIIVVGFHPEILPSLYILTIASSRVEVPVNAATEAILMELVIELLREANVRLPKQIGSSISIVGTIVIGQAAVSAGLVSPLMVIIISLSAMASYAVSDYTVMNTMRLLKFLLIFLSSILGLFGFIMGLSIILIKITSVENFGMPFTSPVTPFKIKDLKNYISSNIVTTKERPDLLDTKDKKRQE
jgi:spore germination protein KA